MSYNITHAVVENGYVASSIVLQREWSLDRAIADSQVFYKALDRSIPVQLDSYILVNDKRQVQQYDISVRRWAWVSIESRGRTELTLGCRDHSTVSRHDLDNSAILTSRSLLPRISGHLHASADSALQQYFAQQVCQATTIHCTGENRQYDSYRSCMEAVTHMSPGNWYNLGDDNLLCRYMHVPLVSRHPATHCPRIGPTGGDICAQKSVHL